MKKYSRYQLISPITGSKIYQSSSINKVANKCYQELKETGNTNDNTDFIILNIDTNEPFTYRLNNKKIQEEKNSQTQSDSQNINFLLASKIDELAANIKEINSEITNIKASIKNTRESKPETNLTDTNKMPENKDNQVKQETSNIPNQEPEKKIIENKCIIQ
jgi:outer membrane murein-binding lipoprotein Lpp